MFSTTSALLNRGLLCEDETMFVHTLHAKKIGSFRQADAWSCIPDRYQCQTVAGKINRSL